MKKYILPVSAACLLLVSCLHSQTTRLKYDNGFTLIYSQKKGCGLVSAVLFLKGGSFGESDEQAGITNITALLLTQGTASRDASKIAIETESLGASIGAGSSNDYTQVSMIVPSENFIPAFLIFSDIVNNPIFPEKELEKVRERTIAAIKSKSDSIFNTAYDRFNENIYSGHPYHKPSVGYEATVASFTLAQVSENYRKNFRPENMVLSVVGDIDGESLKKIVSDNFGNMKIFGSPSSPPVETLPVSIKKSTSPAVSSSAPDIVQGKFQQSYYFCGFLVPDAGQAEYPVLKVIGDITGGGMGSRIFRQLRENSGLVYEADSFYPSRRSTGTFAIYAGTSKENVETVGRLIGEEIKNLSSITPQELNDSREYLKGSYLIDHRTIDRQAWYLGWWETIGRGFEYDTGYINAIDAVTVPDIQKVCEKYLTPEKMRAVIIK